MPGASDTSFTEATATLSAPEPDEEGAGEGGEQGEQGESGQAGGQAGKGQAARGQEPANRGARDAGKRGGPRDGKPDTSGRRDRRAGFQSMEEQITSRILGQVETRWNNTMRELNERLARAGQGQQGQQGQGQQGGRGGEPQPKISDRIRSAEATIRTETAKWQQHDPRKGPFDWTALERSNEELSKLRVLSTLEEMGLTPEAVRSLMRARQAPADGREMTQRMEATARYATFVQEFPWIDGNNELTQQVAAYRDFLVAKGAPRDYQTLRVAAQHVAASSNIDGGRGRRGNAAPFNAIPTGGRGERMESGQRRPRTMALPAGAVSSLSPREKARVEGVLFEGDDE